MTNSKFINRVVSQRVSSMAANLESVAASHGEVLSVEAESHSGRHRLALSGVELLTKHFGDQNTPASGFLQRLLQDIIQLRRSRQ